MGKLAFRELRKLVHPHGVIQTKLSERVMQGDVIQSVAGFVILYLGIFFVSVMIFGIAGHDFKTSLTAVGANIGNIGPGLSGIGSTQTYAWIPVPGKWVLILCMLLGRLEIFTLLVLFVPEFWRK